MENAEEMELFLLFLARNFHIFRIVFIIIPTCKEWGSRGRRFDSCHSDHKALRLSSECFCFFPNRVEPVKVWALRKQSCGLFLAQSGEVGTECVSIGSPSHKGAPSGATVDSCHSDHKNQKHIIVSGFCFL